jgi:hypothetical protein
LEVSKLAHVLEVGHEHVVEIRNRPEEQKQQGHEHHWPRIGAGNSVLRRGGRSRNRSSHTGRKVQKKPAMETGFSLKACKQSRIALAMDIHQLTHNPQ